MPFVRIDLAAGKPASYRKTIGDVVYDAMRATIDVPEDDRFQVITEHPVDGLVFDPHYAGIERSPDCVFIQITLSEGRTLDAKTAFFKAIADGLHERLGMRREDVLINLVETKKENWSFGNGIAQYAV
jgi:phenylpyruvate tautomerase PptA (4-oxalocrotonate tautomerase family)